MGMAGIVSIQKEMPVSLLRSLSHIRLLSISVLPIPIIKPGL
jgi:hypothetical protein